MRPRSYSSQAIILARINYGEADRILVVFSQNFGKLSLLAKGVRRPISKKRGSLEVFSLVKFHAFRGRNLDLISEVEMVDAYKPIRQNLKKVALAYYFVEVVGRTISENESNIQVYNLILDYLHRLTEEKNLKKLRFEFVYDLLVALGFWPKGKNMDNPDVVLESILEREINSKRVGKQIVS